MSQYSEAESIISTQTLRYIEKELRLTRNKMYAKHLILSEDVPEWSKATLNIDQRRDYIQKLDSSDTLIASVTENSWNNNPSCNNYNNFNLVGNPYHSFSSTSEITSVFSSKGGTQKALNILK